MSNLPRRDFLRLLGYGTAGSLLTACTGIKPSQSHPGKRNVLFIAVDDLKPMLGCYGNKRIKTPNMDRLAAPGMTFLNNHCQQAVCGPSRASLLTGMRPDQTRVWDLKTRIRDINPDVVTLPQHFKQHGYKSIGLGKIFDPRSVQGTALDDPASWSIPHFHPRADAESERGYRDPQVVKRLRKLTAQAKAKGIKGYKNIMKHIGYLPTTECVDVPDDAYYDGKLAKHAVNTLTELSKDDAPFFMAVGFKTHTCRLSRPSVIGICISVRRWNWQVGRRCHRAHRILAFRIRGSCEGSMMFQRKAICLKTCNAA